MQNLLLYRKNQGGENFFVQNFFNTFVSPFC
jgi:hypothetical protein